jgi:AraC-like DNA-binding protein
MNMLILGKTQGSLTRARVEGDRVAIDGDRECLLGYKLDAGRGRNGVFVQWYLEDGDIVLENDRYGMYPVYYRVEGRALEFSSSIADLVGNGQPARLNNAAIAAFLRAGSFFGNTTPFEDVEVLPPGATLRFGLKGMNLASVRATSGADPKLSLDQARDAYGELFRASMKKFSNVYSQKVAVPLSGGRDSRHILFAMVASGAVPDACITMRHRPPKSDEDAEVAGQICDRLGLNHVLLEQWKSLLHVEQEKNRLTNFCSLEHSWILPLARFLDTSGYDAAFDGIGGDVLSAGLFLSQHRLDLYRSGKLEQFADELMVSEAYTARLLSRSAHSSFSRQLALELIVNELEKYQGEVNPVSQFFFWNRTRRHIALSSWRILQQRPHVLAPFLDEDLYNLLSGLPPEYFLDHEFHEKTIARQYPQWADIPYETKSKPHRKVHPTENLRELGEVMMHFVAGIHQTPGCNPWSIYPHILKGLLSPSYYLHSKDVFKLPIYLKQFARQFDIQF